jgi:hypothetical protein
MEYFWYSYLNIACEDWKLIVGHPSLLASLIVGISKCPTQPSVLARFYRRKLEISIAKST